MKESRTYIATPPGKLIREQLNDRSMTQKELALRMNITEKHLSQLINGDAPLTPNIAYRLEMVLGVPAEFWLNYEAIYREKLEKVEQENRMYEDIRISEKFPYGNMAKFGWVQKTRNAFEKVTELRKFFEVSDLGLVENPALTGIAFRRMGESENSDYALFAWAQQAKRTARNMEVNAINIEGLKDLIPEARAMTRAVPEVFSPALREKFAACGIALVFLPHIGGSFLNGATFPDGKKIVMGLTLRGSYADKFWFSLFHEIGHIVNGDLWTVRGEESESAADLFARSTMIPDCEFEKFAGGHRFTEASIRAFADQVGIDAGIVVGRLQKENLIPYSKLNKLRQKYAFA